jgi:hypothetical protein
MPIIGIMASAISGNLGLTVDYLVVAGGGGGGQQEQVLEDLAHLGGTPETFALDTLFTVTSWRWRCRWL